MKAKPAICIFLGHLSPNRVNKDAQETAKMQILLSFAKLIEKIQAELDFVLMQREENGSVSYLSLADYTGSVDAKTDRLKFNKRK